MAFWRRAGQMRGNGDRQRRQRGVLERSGHWGESFLFVED
jgi:hypothetical protein